MSALESMMAQKISNTINPQQSEERPLIDLGSLINMKLQQQQQAKQQAIQMGVQEFHGMLANAQKDGDLAVQRLVGEAQRGGSSLNAVLGAAGINPAIYNSYLPQEEDKAYQEKETLRMAALEGNAGVAKQKAALFNPDYESVAEKEREMKAKDIMSQTTATDMGNVQTYVGKDGQPKLMTGADAQKEGLLKYDSNYVQAQDKVRKAQIDWNGWSSSQIQTGQDEEGNNLPGRPKTKPEAQALAKSFSEMSIAERDLMQKNYDKGVQLWQESAPTPGLAKARMQQGAMYDILLSGIGNNGADNRWAKIPFIIPSPDGKTYETRPAKNWSEFKQLAEDNLIYSQGNNGEQTVSPFYDMYLLNTAKSKSKITNPTGK